MNNASSLTPGSPGHFSCPLGEDLQLLLESPSARAASANFFSSHLGTLDPSTLNGAYDLLRSGSLGSSDFTRHLNMAGMFDSNHWPLSPAAALTPQQPFGTLQPEMVLQQSEDQQLDGQAGTSSAVNGLHSSQQEPHRPQLQDQQPQAWLQQLQHESNGAATSTDSAPPAATAGTGIVAVAPVAPAQLPPVVIQQLPERHHQQQQLAGSVPVFDSNNRPGGLPMPMLRPLHIPSAAAATSLSSKLPTAAGVGSPPARTKHQQQQPQQPEHQPTTPRKQTPKQQRQQQQTQAAEASPALDVDKISADGMASSMGPEQWQSTADAAVDVKARAGAAGGALVKQPVGGTAGPAAIAGDALHKPGTLLWAKFPRFPWWPAVVISPTGGVPKPPSSKAANSTADIILVRFLGTHDASWVDPDKALSAWGINQSERSNKTKAAAFVSALKEAHAYVSTGVLPDAFKMTPQLSVAPPPATKTKTKQAKPVAPAANATQTTAPKSATAATAEGATWHSPHQHSLDVWSLAVPPSRAAAAPGRSTNGPTSQAGAAGSLVPVSAVGSAVVPLPASSLSSSLPVAGAGADLAWYADLAAPAAATATAGSAGSSRQHKGQRGDAARVKAPAGPAAGLRSGGKRKLSEQSSGRTSKRSRQQR